MQTEERFDEAPVVFEIRSAADEPRDEEEQQTA